MADEVTNVVQFRGGLERAAGELTAQAVEVQIDEAGVRAGAPPSLADPGDALPYFVAEDVRVRFEVLAVGFGVPRLEHRTQSSRWAAAVPRAPS